MWTISPPLLRNLDSALEDTETEVWATVAYNFERDNPPGIEEVDGVHVAPIYLSQKKKLQEIITSESSTTPDQNITSDPFVLPSNSISKVNLLIFRDVSSTCECWRYYFK